MYDKFEKKGKKQSLCVPTPIVPSIRFSPWFLGLEKESVGVSGEFDGDDQVARVEVYGMLMKGGC